MRSAPGREPPGPRPGRRRGDGRPRGQCRGRARRHPRPAADGKPHRSVPAAPQPSSPSNPPRTPTPTAHSEAGAEDPRSAATHPSPATSAETLPTGRAGAGPREAPPSGRVLARRTRWRGVRG